MSKRIKSAPRTVNILVPVEKKSNWLVWFALVVVIGGLGGWYVGTLNTNKSTEKVYYVEDINGQVVKASDLSDFKIDENTKTFTTRREATNHIVYLIVGGCKITYTLAPEGVRPKIYIESLPECSPINK